MFESIKLRIIRGRQLQPFEVAKVLQNHEDRIKALEEVTSVSSEEIVTHNISFTVTDGTEPIEGATVSIGDITGTTSSAGGCTLQNVAEGSHDVTVTASGYSMRIEEITVSDIETSFEIILVSE